MACTDITPVSGVKLTIAVRSHRPTAVVDVAPNPEINQSAFNADLPPAFAASANLEESSHGMY